MIETIAAAFLLAAVWEIAMAIADSGRSESEPESSTAAPVPPPDGE